MLFRSREILLHKSNASKSHLEKHLELAFRKIALESITFLAIGVRDNNGRRPRGVEAMKVFRVFLDVYVQGNEVLVYERRDFKVLVRLGFQPSTCTSGRCRTEIDEKWFVLFFRPA